MWAKKKMHKRNIVDEASNNGGEKQRNFVDSVKFMPTHFRSNPPSHQLCIIAISYDSLEWDMKLEKKVVAGAKGLSALELTSRESDSNRSFNNHNPGT